MAERPSAPVLRLLREVARKKGFNTSALAAAANIDRARLKHVLGGAEPLTVDELLQLSQALELEVADLASVPEETQEAPGPRVLEARGPGAEEPLVLDPYGNHAEQILKLGFGLGCDLHVVLSTAELAESGVPRHVLARFPEKIPLRFDGIYHRAIDPRFLPDGVQLNLSFDTLYTCVAPWRSFVQVTLFPLPPAEAAEPPPPPAPSGPRRGHLRLVE